MQAFAAAQGLHVYPPHQAVAFQDRKNVIAVAALRLGNENLDPVGKTEEPVRTFPVAQGRVERAENAKAGRGPNRDIVKGRNRQKAAPQTSVGLGDPALDNLSARLRPGAPVSGFGRFDQIPECRQFAGRREAQPIERGATCPVDRLLFGGGCGQMFCRNDALGQVVDFAKPFAARDGKTTDAP